MSKGVLHLIPTTLGESNAAEVIPEYVLSISRNLKHFICENERTTRRYLKAIGTTVPLNDLVLEVLDKHTSSDDIPKLASALLKGMDMGLISEAGLPAIADPGASVVAWCHKNNIAVIPYSGPSSIILALVASGFNGQRFTFHGYLPIDNGERQKEIKNIERLVLQTGYTHLFMETPFRNEKLMQQLIENCKPSTQLSVAADISLSNALIRTMSIAEWKSQKPMLHKRPCVFAIGQTQ